VCFDEKKLPALVLRPLFLLFASNEVSQW